jgi:hypothetical protein
LVTEYSVEAQADARYRPASGALGETIESLKSYDWYKQNPAIEKLSTGDLTLNGKDELFVLGRNIYQAACDSGSRSAAQFLQNLDLEFSRMDEKAVFHILNGMLYEIYFDSQGRKRQSGKPDKIDQVFSLEEKEHYSSSFEFICQALKPYMKELFYIPGKGKDVCIDITTQRLEDGERAISGIFYEGDNIFYDRKGEAYFDPQKEIFLVPKDRAEVHELLSKGLITPSYRLKINYVDFNDPATLLLFPLPPKILRFSK